MCIRDSNYALRAGMAFGGIPPGERENTRDYQRRRVRAFVPVSYTHLDVYKRQL